MQKSLIPQFTEEEKLKYITNRANRTGEQMERRIIESLIGSGYKQIGRRYVPSKTGKSKKIIVSHRIYGYKQFELHPNHIGYSVFETERFKPKYVPDFIVYNDKYPKGFLIECKYQGAKGSADEKLYTLIGNIKKTNIPTIIVASGEGARVSHIEYLKERVKDTDCLLYVMNESQIINYITRI